MVYENNGYIIGFTNSDKTNEENAITEALKNIPQTPEGYGCRLKSDLTWEIFKLPESTESELPEDSEILGGGNTETETM